MPSSHLSSEDAFGSTLLSQLILQWYVNSSNFICMSAEILLLSYYVSLDLDSLFSHAIFDLISVMSSLFLDIPKMFDYGGKFN